MTNRLAMALAVAGGYALGRTKKAKLAIGVGGLVLGRKLQLNPQQLLGAVNKQLASNPAFGELREQLTGDLKGVGRAATGALVNRQLDSLADSLSKRTRDVRDRMDSGRLTGPLTDSSQEADEAEDEEDGGGRGRKAADKETASDRGSDRADDGSGSGEERRPARRAPAKRSAGAKSASRSTGTTGKTAAKSAASKSAGAGSRTKSAARSTGKAASRGGERRG